MYKAYLLAVLTCLLFTPIMVRADTRITDGYLKNGGVWNSAGSPYLIDNDLTVPIGKTLTIGPGVTLNVNGTKDKPVYFSGIYNLNIYYASGTITRANISVVKGVLVDHSSVTISSSTVSGAVNGVYVKAGKVDMVGSRITGNDYGVYIDPVVPIYLYGYDDPSSAVNVGPLTPSTVNIIGSSLVGNRLAAIKSAEKTSTVAAAYNWWGDIAGPNVSVVASSSKAIGQVNYAPWLDYDPTIEATSTPCCSSVLFIPGLEGTWLYRDEPSIFGGAPLIGGTSTNTLWAPNRNDDVRKLFLDSNGSSTDASIYSGKPIDNIFNIYSVYGSFMKFMDSLVSAGKIGEWKSFGYDWRKPIAEVVAGLEKKATTTESLVAIAEDLASRSRTGKVTIVAHSNGGLVAKYLVKALADASKANLVDGVISVAVPYLGTPAAISALLHGDHQSIAGGLILNPDVARQLGINMASAYSLLPSREYFLHILEPVISFASTTISELNDGSYARQIASFDDRIGFVDDASGERSATTTSSDTDKPLKGNSLLASKSDALQSVLADFSWPANVYRWSLVGWGLDTPKSLVYMNKEKCLNIFWFKFGCSTVLARREIMTSLGDGTVLAPSAAYSGTAVLADASSSTAISGVVSVDLASTSLAEKKDISHVNILESSTTQTVIKNILIGDGLTFSGGGTASVTNATSSASGFNLNGVSLGEPDYLKEPVRLVVSVDAQASLSVHDEVGNHTGVVATPAGVEDGVVTAYEEKIPGSHFSMVSSYGGDINNVVSGASASSTVSTTISLPDNGQRYSIAVNGGGFGSFTLDIDRVQGSTTLAHTEFTDIPMTPSSTATTTITLAPDLSVGLAFSTSPMSLDVDGDGTTDLVASSTVTDTSGVGAGSTAVNGAYGTYSATAFKKYIRRFCE